MSSVTAEFGYTPWGRDFLRIAEPTDVTKPEPLLPRARSLARNAMTDVRVEGRLIRGTVVRGGAGDAGRRGAAAQQGRRRRRRRDERTCVDGTGLR